MSSSPSSSPIKVYFCASIRGGSVDKPLLRRIISYLSTHYGPVLTSHIGDDHPDLDLGGTQTEDKDHLIWKRDNEWLRECHVVIAECTAPSLGVGYELAIAEILKKPTLCLFHSPLGSEKTVSALVGGNPHFETHNYAEESQIVTFIDHFMSNFNFEKINKKEGEKKE